MQFAITIKLVTSCFLPEAVEQTPATKAAAKAAAGEAGLRRERDGGGGREIEPRKYEIKKISKLQVFRKWYKLKSKIAIL